MGTLRSKTLGNHPATLDGVEAEVTPAGAVADAAAITATATDEDVAKVHADLVALRNKVNQILASLRAADLMED